MSEQQNDKRTRVLKLLSTGHLTQAEAAALIGVTRQRIHQWVTAAGLHPTLARIRYLRELVRNADI
jgi:transcriptional regulator with XRE-family HTH domain